MIGLPFSVRSANCRGNQLASFYKIESGGMGEWLKPAVLKTVCAERCTGVRIPLPPPDYLLSASRFCAPQCENGIGNSRRAKAQSPYGQVHDHRQASRARSRVEGLPRRASIPLR